MAEQIIICERGLIPEEVTVQATQEAYELWDRLYELEQYGVGVQEEIPEIPHYAPMISLRMRNLGEYATIGEVAPATLGILRQLGTTSLDGYKVPRGFRPGGFTINFMGSGQKVPTHRDNGAGEYASLSCIANILGEGRFTLLGSDNEEDVIEELDVSEGDVHAFLNPAKYHDRLPHYATNTGASTRISLGFVIPQIPVSTTTSE